MADRWAILVAVEKPLHPALGPAPSAVAGAQALAEALAGAGYPPERQTVLLNSHATAAAVASRVRKLRAAVRPGDEVLAYFGGRAGHAGGATTLFLWDTLPDDVPGTGFVLGEFAAVAGNGVVLLDVADGPAPAGFEPGVNEEEMAERFTDAVALTASEPGEPSHAAAKLKATAWTYLVAEAFSGRAANAAGKDGRLTATSLQRYLRDELPRILRKYLEPGARQTPQLFGTENAGRVLAEPAATAGAADGAGLLDPGRLRRVVFRSDTAGRVKDLGGFRKTHSVPDNTGPYNRKFVARISEPDLKADLDGVFAAAREHLGYKRKDIEVSTEADGSGFLRGPDFEYTITVTLDNDDPSQVRWRREVGGFADAGFVRTAGFDAVFGKQFDQLAFEFQAPVDVAALVDRLEDAPPKGVKVRVAADADECEVTLAGFTGRVLVGRGSLTVRGRAGDSAGLLDQLLRFLRAVGPVGEPLALPGA